MHNCEVHNPIDIENKKKLNAPDAVQLLLTLYTFLGTLIIKLKYLDCGWKWDLWIDIMFYGSIVWLAFLLITMIAKFKSSSIRAFVKYLDIFFFIFHLAMWIWLVVISSKSEYFDACSDPVDLFGFVYLVLGGICVLMVALSLFGFCCGMLRPKDNIGTGVDRGVYDYDDDVDFNPYQ